MSEATLTKEQKRDFNDVFEDFVESLSDMGLEGVDLIALEAMLDNIKPTPKRTKTKAARRANHRRRRSTP